jgi:hypothetical protein
MRFSRNGVKRREERRRRRSYARFEWGTWFAWRPVKSRDDSQWLWMETVYTRLHAPRNARFARREYEAIT